MTEEAKNQAVTEQDLGTPEANTQADTSQEPAQSQEPKEGSKEFNFRRLENEKKELERRLKDQESMFKEVVGTLHKQQGQQSLPKEEVLPNLNPDDIPEWQHVQSYAEKIAEKKVREILEKQERERLPQTVKAKYQDFDEVVTPERIEKLEKENPELAQAISLARDPYTATYSYLKAVYAQKKPNPAAMEEAEKILENAKKPVSSNAVGQQGALKNANTFQKKSREELYREMMHYASQA